MKQECVMTRKATLAKLLVLSVAAGATFSAFAQSQRQCDVCPIEQTSQPAVVSAAPSRDCDSCPGLYGLERERIRLSQISPSKKDDS